MQAAIRSILRCTAVFLAFNLLLNQMAYAATPSRRLTAVLLQHAAAQEDTRSQASASSPSVAPPAVQAGPAAVPASTGPATPSEDVARARLLAAHTVFLARQTQDAHFPASPEDAYNNVLSSLQNWGRYKLVDNVAQADLVLQLRDAVHESVTDGTPPDNTPSVYYTPGFQLTLAEPSSLAPIWVVNVPVSAAIKKKGTVDLLAVSSENLVSQLKLLVGDPLTAQDQAAQKNVRSYSSHTGLAIGLVAGAAALSLGLFFLFRHNAQSNQAAFCAAHGISPCPGS